MLIRVNGNDITCGTGGRPLDVTLPSIIFLHGAGMDHTCWMLQARAYAWSGWSAFAPDLPGHGRSSGTPLTSVKDMAAWIGNLMDAAKIERAALVGHSMGGAMALEAARLMPDRITHLAVVGSAATIPVSDALLTSARDTPEKAYGLMTTWAHSTAARMGGNPTPGLWMTGGSRAIFDQNKPGTLYNDLAACNVWSTGASAAASIKCPTLVITGGRDLMTAPKRGAELAQIIPGAKLVDIPSSGHMIMAEAPNACLQALRSVIHN
ncbi:MAG: alpha/beta hydrolase [Hyphomicrobiaceae bacterium]|nr:alpha/beta hydrolase [Hyphomicrobiaceae bacterium]